jgi:hypothetical protein
MKQKSEEIRIYKNYYCKKHRVGTSTTFSDNTWVYDYALPFWRIHKNCKGYEAQ